MAADDLEALGVDEGMADGDDEDGLEPEANLVTPPGGKRDLIIGLWPFAFSKEYYKAIVEGLCGGERLSHIVVLTTSAYPAHALMAHDLRLTAHVLLDRVSGHSRAHGRQVLRDFLYRGFYNAERAAAGHALAAGGAKRIRTEDLTFIRVPAPPLVEQTLCFEEVPGDASTSAWRAGMDEFPAGDALEAGVLALLQHELETCGLAVRPAPAPAGGRPVLVTEKGRGEGDALCPVSCLLFSSRAGLHECISSGGNSALLDGPLFHVPGLRCPGGGVGGPGGEVMDAYGIPVGAARLVSDYRAAGRHHPNAGIRARPSRGPNDGFLELVVRTHNGHGIAAGREIVLDFGAARAIGLEPTEPPIKRFKGALDALLAKQMEEARARDGALGAEDAAIPVATMAPASASSAGALEADGAATPAVAPAPAQAAILPAAGDSFRVELPAGGGITITAAGEGVTKIAPKTLLTLLVDGNMEEPPPDALEADLVQWAFKRCNTQARRAARRVGRGRGRRARPGQTRGEKHAREN